MNKVSLPRTVIIFFISSLLCTCISCSRSDKEITQKETGEEEEQTAEEKIDPIKEYGIYKSIFEHDMIDLLDTELSKEDLENYSLYKLKLVRNTYAARKGYIFKSVFYDTHFRKQSWYSPRDNVKLTYSEIEQKNIALIKEAEKKLNDENKIDAVTFANNCFIYMFRNSSRVEQADSFLETSGSLIRKTKDCI